jgi:hypothetical protein
MTAGRAGDTVHLTALAHHFPPPQGWKTFLHNHADGIAAIDLFVVPTLSFRM